ncbi:MAG TPA: 50S ribosomal protein L15 [Verrucomicrobiae bacterium]|nr:50S ribosomal protein L15 [Verrucomicrobiae bacterium]
MTKYHELKATTSKNKKRVGRGISAGQGKTAGRGTKGQKARTGKKLNATFMGGQRALMQAVPKLKGFKSLRTPAQVVYFEDLKAVEGKTADNFTLFEAGLIMTPFHSVKVIARGDLSSIKGLTLRTQGASKSVKAALEANGGAFEKIAVPLQQSAKQKAE